MRSEKPEPPADGDFRGWLRTAWEGVRYPPFYMSHFRHEVRVRLLAGNVIEAEYFDDETRIPGAGGNRWRRISVPGLAKRLYTQAIQAQP